MRKELPVLVLCADCGRVVRVKATKDRNIHSVVWSYCENCLKKRAAEVKRREAQRMIQLAFPA